MDDFRTLRQLIVGWLLLLVALIPMNAQNGNVLGQVIRLPVPVRYHSGHS